MTRKAKREIAKARQRNADSRVADKWTMQHMAVDLGEKDTEIEQLRAALERTLPVLAAAAAGVSVMIAAGDVYRDTRAALAALTTGQTAGKSDE